MPITILHFPDLMVAARSIHLDGAAPHEVVRAALDLMAPGGHGRTGAPDLVVVTGNVAEHALSAEYEHAYSILATIRDTLKIDTRRIILVPGSNDVNRGKCKAHFIERSANDEQPVPPYWDKWQPYVTMTRRFHGTELPKDQPWSLTEYPDLRVVVGAVNSTVAESHLPDGRYGVVGSEQLHWFADRLAGPRYGDWHRIAVLHHRPGGDGDARLRDAEEFADVLGPHLDLILHGQTGDLTAGAGGPPMIGGRSGGCQVVDVRADRIVVRRKAEDDDSPAVWDLAAPRPPAAPRPKPAGRSGGRATVDRLVARVTEICALRYPGAEVSPVRWHGRGSVTYLRVAPDQPAGSGQRLPSSQLPIGLYERAPGQDDVSWFLNEVVVRFRAGGATPEATLVHAGPPADPVLRGWAHARGVEVVSFAEFQLGHGLGEFVRRQAEDLRADPIYPEGLYVPQRYTEFRGGLPDATETAPRADILAWLRAWVEQPQGRLVVVLGTFGHGKTFLLRQLARRMHADGCPTVPVLIDLRGCEKTYTLDDLVAVQLSRRGQRLIDLDTFQYLRRAGRLALLFDGFDELAARVSYSRATHHLDTIVRAAEDWGKVIVTSRDQHFLTDSDVLAALSTQVGTGRRAVKLADFDDDQILAFLTNRLGREAAAQRLTMLHDVKDLLGLSRNPRMLSFITDLEEDRLRRAASDDGTVTAASLYREILDRWLSYEAERLDRLGAVAPTKRDLFDAVSHLAQRLWDAPDDGLGLSLDDLDEVAGTISQLSSTAIGETAGLERPETTHLLGSSTLLVRHGYRRFAFVHHSVWEWLVAEHIAKHLAVQQDRTTGTGGGGHLLGRSMSPLMIDFLCGLAGPETMRGWAEHTLAGGPVSQAIGRNAVEILRHLWVTATAPLQMAGFDLRGKDFTARPLAGADLTGANLTDTRLVGTNLREARLTRASLVGARLDRAVLRGADLTDADLTGANLLGADLTGATLTRASLRRAALIGAEGVFPDDLTAADTTAAALPGAGPPRPQFGSPVAVDTLATDPPARLVAGGGADGVIRIWDVGNGLLLRTLTGHAGTAQAVAYAPDGAHLASAGDDGMIRIWDAATGEIRHALAGHTGWIRALAYAPDSRTLASAGHDSTIRIWDTGTGELRHILIRHTGWIRALSHSADGRRLVSGGDDETVRVWNARTGELLRVLAGHTGTVHAVACAPAARFAASASDDRTVRLWDIDTGEVLHTLRGHTGWIRAIAYAPDGRDLASADHDGVIRIWDTRTGRILHTLCGHAGSIHSLAYCHGGRRLATAGDDDTVRIWDVAARRQVRTIGGDGGESRAVAFAPDGRWLVSGANDGTVHVWEPVTGSRPRALTGHEGAVEAVAVSPAGDRLATAGRDRTIRIWNPDADRPDHVLTGHEDAVHAIAFAPDGALLASAGGDATVRIWQTRSGTPAEVLTGHTGAVGAVAFSPGGGYLVSAGDDASIRVWATGTGRALRTLTGHIDPVRALAFSPDGRVLASADDDGTIRLWGTTSSHPPGVLTGHAGAVNAVVFSPAGDRLASAGQDGSIRIWDTGTGRPVHRLTGDSGWIRALAYTPDGRHLASAGGDRAIRLWPAEPVSEAADGGPRVELVPLADGGSAALFDDLGYAIDGVPRGEFWYAIGMCRFEPGELDAYLPELRTVPPGTRLW